MDMYNNDIQFYLKKQKKTKTKLLCIILEYTNLPTVFN